MYDALKPNSPNYTTTNIWRSVRRISTKVTYSVGDTMNDSMIENSRTLPYNEFKI